MEVPCEQTQKWPCPPFTAQGGAGGNYRPLRETEGRAGVIRRLREALANKKTTLQNGFVSQSSRSSNKEKRPHLSRD